MKNVRICLKIDLIFRALNRFFRIQLIVRQFDRFSRIYLIFREFLKTKNLTCTISGKFLCRHSNKPLKPSTTWKPHQRMMTFWSCTDYINKPPLVTLTHVIFDSTSFSRRKSSKNGPKITHQIEYFVLIVSLYSTSRIVGLEE